MPVGRRSSRLSVVLYLRRDIRRNIHLSCILFILLIAFFQTHSSLRWLGTTWLTEDLNFELASGLVAARILRHVNDDASADLRLPGQDKVRFRPQDRRCVHVISHLGHRPVHVHITLPVRSLLDDVSRTLQSRRCFVYTLDSKYII